MMLIYFLLLCLHNVVQCQIYHGYDLFPEKKWVSSDCTTSQNYLTLSSCIDSCTAVNWCKGGWYNTRWPRSCELCRDLTTSTPTVRAPSKMAFLREAEASLEEVILILTGMNDKLTKELEELRKKLEKVEGTLEEGESTLEEAASTLEEVESTLEGVANATKDTCTHGCCEIKGCFFFYPSSQCFCYWNLTEQNITWEAGVDICKEAETLYELPKYQTKMVWRLPHPIDAVALRSTLVQECGNCGRLWMNAKFDVNQGAMVWWNQVYDVKKNKKIDYVEITNVNPLIKNPPIAGFVNGECLQMAVSETALKTDNKEPYRVQNCNAANTKVILCEREIRTMGHN